tara:strand:- start:640 stop:858 length:219 start_codon:yes stop_codon:yes gene_type:complete
MFNEIKFHNDKAYVVKRRLPVHNFVFKSGQIEMQAVKMYMEHINCDHVLRDQSRGDAFLFCETIQEAEILID